MKGLDNLNDELEGLSPTLRGLREQADGFNVPAGYFDHFEASVYQRIQEKGIERPGMQAIRGKGLRATLMKPRAMMAIAATLTLVLSAWWFFSPQPAASAVSVAGVEISDDELEGYLLENIHDFDADQLAALPEDVAQVDETPAAIPGQHPKAKTAPDDLSPEDIEEMLKDMSDDELEQLL